MNDEEKKYREAKDRVEEIKGFYIHFIIYIFVNIGLFLINYLTGTGTYWFYYPLIGWGIGLAAHYVAVFGFFGLLGEDWERRKIDELMNKDK
jgi:hypothetical protein